MKPVAWAALAAVLQLAAMPSAYGEPRFALICVGTDTSYAINYEYRWGDGEWKPASVEPGRWKLHMYPYRTPGSTYSPGMEVRYDDDPGARTNHVVTALRAYAADEEDCEEDGWLYDFWERDGELFIGNAE